MKTMNKTLLSAAVAGALGVAGGAQAESILMPIVASDVGAGFETFFAIKVEDVDSSKRFNKETIRYTFQEKADNPNDLLYAVEKQRYTTDPSFKGQKCEKFDLKGKVSDYDMIFQSAGNQLFGDFQAPAGDQSLPRYLNLPFYGFTVLDTDWDESGRPRVSRERDYDRGEGDLSAFGYILDTVAGNIYAYKGLNNPNSTESGDFEKDNDAVGKDTVDFSWWPFDIMDTFWWVLATGDDMTDGDWDRYVTLLRHEDLAFDHDEDEISTEDDLKIRCLNVVTIEDLVTDQALAEVEDGGWTRFETPKAKRCRSEGKNGRDECDKHEGEGEDALVFKFEVVGGNGQERGLSSLTIETSGGNGSYNRPY